MGKGKGKGHYNKDTERARQEKNRVGRKFGSPTALRLKEKLTGQNREEEIKAFMLIYSKTTIMHVIVVLLREH